MREPGAGDLLPISLAARDVVTKSAFLLTGKTGENFPPDGTVQFFPQEIVERKQLYHLTMFSFCPGRI